MRYRVNDYKITVSGSYVYVHFNAPTGVTISGVGQIKEAIRLVVDEEARIVFCSSMQKGNIASVSSSDETGYSWRVKFEIPTGKTVATTDPFTFEMDWGDMLPTDYAKQSNVGTSSDQASESGSSLFAMLKAVWNKAVSIYDALTTGANSLSSIKGAIPSVSGLAQESSVSDNGDTAIGLLKDQTNGLAAIKTAAASAATAASGITGYALQGSNSAKTNTQLSSEIADVATLIGYTISEIDNV